MRAALLASLALCLLVLGVILLSSVGTARLEGYLDALPAEDTAPAAGAAALDELLCRTDREMGLLNAIFHHTRVDELGNALCRALAAARSDDTTEYRILLGEVERILLAMRRDLCLVPFDLW